MKTCKRCVVRILLAVVSIDRDGAGTTFAQADLVTLEKVQTTLAELLANQQIII